METKRDIRKRMLARRAAIPEAVRREKSRRIAKMVTALSAFLEADLILCYIDFRCEVSTKEIIDRAFRLGIPVAAPRVCGGTMRFCAIGGETDLEPGHYGILEPKADCPVREPTKRSLMIVPGTAFTADGSRMGYGGGFYDRYLAAYPCVQTAGVAYAEQIVPELPVEETDRKLRLVVTDETIYSIMPPKR